MNVRHSLLVPVLLAAVSLPLAAADGARGVAQGDGARAVPDVRVVDRGPAAVTGKFTGITGHQYDPAPLAVTGKKGWLYYGWDFDNACSLGGAGLKKAADQLARTANIIRESGRRVLWTMAPNKTAALARYVRTKQLPHGKCDRKGLADQTRIMRNYRSPGYVPMVDVLAKSKHQTYWKTDPHWSTVGGSLFAKQLAQMLNPRLARIQRTTFGTETGVGALNLIRGVNTEETLERAFPATKVKVTPRPTDTPWTGYPELVFEHSWDTKPARKTWPGHTLIIGDSFSMFGLASLRPVFRHGRWMWFSHVALQDLVKAIKQSDTVVIEVYELFVPGTIVSTRAFQRELRQALLR